MLALVATGTVVVVCHGYLEIGRFRRGIFCKELSENSPVFVTSRQGKELSASWQRRPYDGNTFTMIPLPSPAASARRGRSGWAGQSFARNARAQGVLGLLLTGALGFARPAFAEERGEPPDPYQLLDDLGETLSTVENQYFEPVDSAELLDGALRGLVAGLDPHSNYFSVEDLDIFEGDTSGHFGGVGVEVDFSDGEIVVIAPVEGSPAARAGIVPGDVIIGIDGLSVQEKKPDELVRAMRGPIGSTVRIVVKKASGELTELVLRREEIHVRSVNAVRLDGGIGYLRIKAFQEDTHDELLEALGGLLAAGPLSGILLDLRNNPGGLVREAEAVADEFLSGGVIYSMRHRGVVERSAEAHGGGAYTRGPLVVLVNEYSASAAELVSAALHDHRRAILVGTRTFGKGSVQTVLPLESGAAIKLTTALYYSPSGQTLQASGVSPDVTIEPEKAKGAVLPILRERDLEGHIEAQAERPSLAPHGVPGENDPAHAAGPAPSVIPVSDDELLLGVARTVPADPSQSRDVALRAGWQIVRGEKVRK